MPMPLVRSTADIIAPSMPYFSRKVGMLGRLPCPQSQMLFAVRFPLSSRVLFTGWVEQQLR